jgi:hypothetical protein
MVYFDYSKHTMRMKVYRSSIFLILASLSLGCLSNSLALAQEVYGPVDIVKTMPTPFGSGHKAKAGGLENSLLGGALRLEGGEAERSGEAISISSTAAVPPRRSLSDRLIQSRLYLPGRMLIGRTAEFTIKGRPGYFAALAMADKDSGAKPIYGHALRLGPDRKVVSVGQIPEDGILHLVIDTPIEGDLIGQPLYFEAAIWSRPDFGDVEIASTVTSEGQPGVRNGVIVAAEPNEKRGVKFVPETTMPSMKVLDQASGLNSGRP